MADGGMTLTIDEQLAARLRTAADRAGESLEVYARHALEAYAGFEEADVAYWNDVAKIAQDTVDGEPAFPSPRFAPGSIPGVRTMSFHRPDEVGRIFEDRHQRRPPPERLAGG
jgi:hypothetical protein